MLLKKACGISEEGFEGVQLKKVSALTSDIYKKLSDLEKQNDAVKSIEGASEVAMFFKDNVIPAMSALREKVDEMELLVPKAEWPVPSYGDLLFSVR